MISKCFWLRAITDGKLRRRLPARSKSKTPFNEVFLNIEAIKKGKAEALPFF